VEERTATTEKPARPATHEVAPVHNEQVQAPQAPTPVEQVTTTAEAEQQSQPKSAEQPKHENNGKGGHK
jgi:hypothetical protein